MARVDFAACAAAMLLLACTQGCIPPPVPRRAPLELRRMQSREYDRLPGGTLSAMKAVIDVLQDDGFIIKNADKELGFIAAVKESDVQDRWESIFAELAQGESARYRKNSVLDCSVNVTEFGSQVRVRAVFQAKVLDNAGAVVSVNQLDDPAFYQDFFARVAGGLFIERERL